MSWFKVDDGLPSSRKVLAIPRPIRCSALGLWSLGGAWCSKELMDGMLPKYMVEELGGSDELAEALVKCGMWEDNEEHYIYHDWFDYQPSREEVTLKRKKNAERLRVWREKNEASNDVGNAVTNTVTNTVSTRRETPPPTRPDPTRPDPLVKSMRETSNDGRFDEFWGIYPRKVAKVAAKRKWDTLVKTVDPEQIISGAKVYARSVRDSEARFIKQPDGWLNAGRWEDDLEDVKEYDELGFLL